MNRGEDKVLDRFIAKSDARRERGAQYRTYTRWMGRALEVPVFVVVGLLLGRFLEGWLPIEPWGTWGGLFFGTAGAIRALVRIVRAYRREEGP